MSAALLSDRSSSKVDQNTISCPVFNGVGALEYMLFSIQWRKLMQSKSVEEQIIHGKINGVPLSEVRCKPVDKVRMACMILTADHEAALENSYRTKFTRFLIDNPFFIYYLRNLSVPVGVNNGKRTVRAMPNPQKLEILQNRVPGWADRVALDLWIGVPPEPVLDATAELCDSTDRMMVMELLEAAYLRSHVISYLTVKNDLIALNPAGDGTYLNEDWDTWFEANLSTSQAIDFEKQFENARAHLGKATDELISENNRCSQIFSRLGPNATSMARGEIQRREWHAAFTVINGRYLEKGIGDVSVFERKVDTILMEKGQPLQEHLDRVQEALRQWATVIFLSNENIRLGGNLNHASINMLECDANAGPLQDAEIVALGFNVLISHKKRYDIYQKSVDGVSRFTILLATFQSLPFHQKSLSSLLDSLENIEKTEKAMEEFRKEAESLSSSNPDKKRTALQASATGSSKKIREIFTCKFHPGRSVNHSEKDCFLNPASKNAGKTVKASPTITASTYSKKLPRCSYCETHNPLLAPHHGEDSCWHNPASPSYDKSKTGHPGRKSSKSSSKSPGMSSDFVDRVGKMETNIVKSLIAQLKEATPSSSNKKRKKGVQSDGEESN